MTLFPQDQSLSSPSPAPSASKMSRRTFGKLAAGATAAAAVSPTLIVRSAKAQINPGDELVVGIWGGAQERITREFCAAPLEEKYGVTINFVLGGTVDRRARAYAERGRPSFDIVYLNIFESRQAVRDGVTQAPSEAVPNFVNLYDLAQVGGYGVAFNPVTIVYDSSRVEEPITRWADLWRDDLRGRISWPPFPGAQGTSALMMAARVHGGDEYTIDPGFETIQALKPFASMHSSQDELIAFFEQEVCDVGIEFGSFMQAYKDSSYPNLEVIQPEEGLPIAANFACITEGTQNQALAEEWIDLHLGIPCQTAYAEQIYYGPTNRLVELPTELQERLVYGEDDVAQLLDFDWDHIIENQAQWSSRFNREIAG